MKFRIYKIFIICITFSLLISTESSKKINKRNITDRANIDKNITTKTIQKDNFKSIIDKLLSNKITDEVFKNNILQEKNFLLLKNYHDNKIVKLGNNLI